MALTGGVVTNPRNGRSVRWQPVRGVADDFAFIAANSGRGYSCLGVIGNESHLLKSGGHTPWCSEGGAKAGWVYAIDAKVADPVRFEQWLLAQLRAGSFPEMYYFNINNRHWSRGSVRAGVPFASPVYSADEHFHASRRGGFENTPSLILPRYEAFRTGQPVESTPAHNWFDAAAAGLPVVRKGVAAPKKVVRMLEGLLTANGHTIRMDGVVDSIMVTAVRDFQSEKKLTVDGICGPATWKALVPAEPATVKAGTTGWTVRIFQSLLLAQGYDLVDGKPVRISGTADDLTIEAMRRFQSERKVPNSVVNGRGDGIGGQRTWLALLAV